MGADKQLSVWPSNFNQCNIDDKEHHSKSGIGQKNGDA